MLKGSRCDEKLRDDKQLSPAIIDNGIIVKGLQNCIFYKLSVYDGRILVTLSSITAEYN